MSIHQYKTVSINKKNIPQEWVEIDAAGQIVGRLASRIAYLLKGKHQPFYTPHIDCGTHVVLINAAHVRFTGNKEKNKHYLRYTGHPGGQRATTPERLRAQHPTRILENAIKGMLRNNRLNRHRLHNKLHIYPGAQHPHEAQTKSSDTSTP